MIFVALTDSGILTQPIEADTFAVAAAQLKQIYGLGSGQVRLALLLPGVTGTMTQHPTDPAHATIQMTGDAQTQKQIRDNAQAFLALQTPNNAQVLAAVRALVRLAVGDFTGTG